MALTALQIANMALDRLLAKRVTAFGDTSVPYGSYLEDYYNQAKAEVLRLVPWPCATDFCELSPIDYWVAETAYEVGDYRFISTRLYIVTVSGTSGTTGPVGTTVGETETDGTVTWEYLRAISDNLSGFENRFILPSDYVTLQEVKRTQYDRRVTAYRIYNGILCAREDSIIIRYTKNIDAEYFDPLLDNAIILYLAWKLSARLTEGADTNIYQEYAGILTNARAKAMMESQEDIEGERWITEIMGGHRCEHRY